MHLVERGMADLIIVSYKMHSGLVRPSQWKVSAEVCGAFLAENSCPSQWIDRDDRKKVKAQLDRWFRLMRPLLPNMVRLADIDEASDREVILANYKKPFQRARFGRVLREVRRQLLTARE
jgi:hypothetical protein